MFNNGAFENGLDRLEDICMYAGDTKNIQIDVEIESEEDFDTVIENNTIKMILCDIDNEQNILLEKMAVLNKEIKAYEITLSTSDTIKIPVGKYRYILHSLYETGDVNVSKGFLTIF